MAVTLLFFVTYTPNGVAAELPPPTSAGLPEENTHAGESDSIRML